VLFVVLVEYCRQVSRVCMYGLFRYLVQWVHMALHGTVEDETQMVVVCYERIAGAEGMVQAPGDFS
jgi:hypothetical protein